MTFPLLKIMVSDFFITQKPRRESAEGLPAGGMSKGGRAQKLS
jgi:hypothetical protein